MAATLCPGGGASPISLSRTIERAFEDARHTGDINLNGRKLREFPKMAPKYDLVDTITAGEMKFSASNAPISKHKSQNKLSNVQSLVCNR